MPLAEFNEFSGIGRDTTDKDTKKIVEDLSNRLAVLSGFKKSVFEAKFLREVYIASVITRHLPQKLQVQLPIIPKYYCIDCFQNDSLIGRAPYIRNEWLHLWALHCRKHVTPLGPLGGSGTQIYSYRYGAKPNKQMRTRYWDEALILERPEGSWKSTYYARKVSVDLSRLLMGYKAKINSYFYNSRYSDFDTILDSVYALIFILSYVGEESDEVLGNVFYRQGFYENFDSAVFKRNMRLFSDLNHSNFRELLKMAKDEKADLLNIVGLFLMSHKPESKVFDNILHLFNGVKARSIFNDKFRIRVKCNPLILLVFLVLKTHKTDLQKEIKKLFPKFSPFWNEALIEYSELLFD